MTEERASKYTVAVRALCEFTAKQGDLDRRFTPSPSAQEGIAGHAAVTLRRPPPYEVEISLSGEYKHLLIRGRADGYDPVHNQLDEIKTFRGELGAMPGNHRHLHWAQAKIYAWLLCQKRALSEINVALIYFDIVRQRETILVELYSADALETYFEAQCERFIDWSEQELAHRAARNEALTHLRFPHPDFRPGQRDLAEAVYKAASAGCCLIAQAPTGIGKTIGTIFPQLRAWPRQDLDKLFFLVAKTPGRRVALDALGLIGAGNPALPLRVLELVARDKACVYPDNACHGESCPLAKGFYDRLPQARQAALAGGLLDQQALRNVALEHQVCPYYLSQELVRWCDVIVGDYNYYYDVSAMLYALTVDNEWRVSVLVDEAHNLLERARKMYTATLEHAVLRVVRDAAPRTLKPALDRLGRRWSALHEGQSDAYQVHATLPTAFLTALHDAITQLSDYFAANPSRVEPELQGFFFDALHFSRMAEAFDAHSLFDITKQSDANESTSGHAGSVLCLRNVVPAPFLKRRFAAARSTILFSATLSPRHFYSDTLGLPENTQSIDVQSPFAAEQLAVRVVDQISTRYQHRAGSLAPIVGLMAQQYDSQPGNYLTFFSSFEYLQKAAGLFSARYPHIPMWAQSRQMSERDREQFLARFTAQGRGIGFAVLGGAFAEGIDLRGERLIGAFIATLGLPQLNPVNEQIRQRMETTFGAGFDYTYLYPGIQKVVQAAGRVIRTEDDRGVVYLMDDRFARTDVRRLLPSWWKVERCGGPAAVL
ncbi:MAG TPA: helicase C-terminal domain-containing protein [Burkholderiales bacterium]|nr:helicase C-terminal domain-containing protein [Burkholderiales bacterium]